MGNLCSSGAERSEKKEEAQLPDKPRDGEDEALLPKGDAAVEIDTTGVQLSVDGGGGAIPGEVPGVKEDTILSDVSMGVESESQQFASQAQSAFTRVVQSGKDGVDKGVQDVKSGATTTVAEISASAKSAAGDTLDTAKSAAEDAATNTLESAQQKAEESFQAVTSKAEEAVQQGKQQATTAVESATSGISRAFGAARNDVSTAQNEAQKLQDDVEQTATSVVDNTSSLAQTTVESSSEKLDAAASQVESLTLAGVENAQNSAAGVTESVDQAAENVVDEISTSQDVEEKGLQEQLLEKFDELKSSTIGVTESARQAADNKINEATESVKQSASETFNSVSQQFSQKLGAASDSVAGVTQSVNSEVESTQHSAENAAGVVEQSGEDLAQGADQVVTGRLSAALDSVSSGVLSVKDEASQAVKDVADATASTIDDAEDAIAEAKLGGEIVSENSTSEEVKVSQGPEPNNESVVSETRGSGVFESFGESAKGALLSGVEVVKEKVVETVQGIIGGTQQDASVGEKDEAQDDQQNDSVTSQAGDSEENFLDKAKSLLEAHRNSIDGSKAMASFTQDINLNNVDSENGLGFTGGDLSLSAADVELQSADEKLASAAVGLTGADVELSGADVELSDAVTGLANDVVNDAASQSQEASQNDSVEVQDSEVNPEADDAAQEATARDFVESIIEKASNLVSESLNTNESIEEDSSASEVSVERGEETLEPKKRGVMFVSPQRSEQSSSPLSSPPEFSPPPQVESDISPPTDSPSSSLSPGEIVEKEDLPSPPTAPPTIELSTNENNNNNNILNNNAEDDDESIQRVAMEVTAKAVQDAIKIVTENGTGSFLSNPILSNDLGVSSASSPDNEEEEMTTTDSSQVERGSPVSDITDTSAQGSISESLSSYDPGAVFRQDVANLSDLATSPVDNLFQAETQPASEFPAAPANVLVNNISSDLINFDEHSSSQGNTPTPTNASSFDAYPPPPISNDVQSNADGNPPFSEVPSSLSFDDDNFSSSPSKPTIIINSPDSAHHTNGSAEDLSTSQTEALI